MSYDGAHFSGYQIQFGKRTVQGEVEKALAQIHKGRPIQTAASGRTDKGVHAKSQVFHFDTSLEIPEPNWQKALNSLLPDDIYIKCVERVSDTFHARFDAFAKEYRYFIRQETEPDVFLRHYVYHFPYELDLEAIKTACRYLEGTHDFTTFSSAKASVKGSRVRTLYQARCEQTSDGLAFIFCGDGFLYHMVRILVGHLLDIGRGEQIPSDIPELFAKKDRRLAGATVPPQGLYLWEVFYHE